LLLSLATNKRRSQNRYVLEIGSAAKANFSQAKRFAKAMHASLIFCSTSASVNVQKIFKIVLAKAFDLKCVIPEIEGVGEPILLYVDV
jgi:hypothetical protein